MKIYYNDTENTNIAPALERMHYLVETIPGLIKQIPEADFRYKSTPEKWSKQQILGHLIDSATNNHQRFIRIQYEDKPVIGYNQDSWNNLSGYQDMRASHVTDMWTLYNQHLIHVVKNISHEKLERKGLVNGQEMTLAWYINDYVEHMEHHLREIVSY